jgi:hypothetical protein
MAKAMKGSGSEARTGRRHRAKPVRQESPSGRAASAAIVARLRAALESGRALTYEELAAKARCTERTVRNYLDDADAALGVSVVRARDRDHAVRVRLRQDDATATIEKLALELARQMLRSIFPVAGTALDRSHRHPRVQLVVAVRGAYEYREEHMRALRAWLNACAARPRVAVRFEYTGMASGPGERIVWPLGVVVRDAAKVYVAGIPAEAERGSDVRTYALERLAVGRRESGVDVLEGETAGSPPPGIDQAVLDTALDIPFSVFPARQDNAVVAHARFSAGQAPYIEGRRWHRRQRMRRNRDGSLELRFGPADRGEVEAWLRGWGDTVVRSRIEKVGRP